MKTLNNNPEKDTIIQELKDVINTSPIFPKIRHLFIAQDFITKELAKEIWTLLKPAGILAGYFGGKIWGGQDGRGDCRTSLPHVTHYASIMSMRDPNSWHMPNPGWQFNLTKFKGNFQKGQYHFAPCCDLFLTFFN